MAKNKRQKPALNGIVRFKPGMRVIYIPLEAGGDTMHRLCKHGVISSVGRTAAQPLIHVKFDVGEYKCVTGREPITSQACDPKNLQREHAFKHV